MLLTRDSLPRTIPDLTTLDDFLCRPSQTLIDDLAGLDGDIMILGVAGKMGPTLAGLAKAALPDRRIIGVVGSPGAGKTTLVEALLDALVTTGEDQPDGWVAHVPMDGFHLANSELARRLHVSSRTVEHHVAAILGKLSVNSRTEAVVAAFGLGLADSD